MFAKTAATSAADPEVQPKPDGHVHQAAPGGSPGSCQTEQGPGGKNQINLLQIHAGAKQMMFSMTGGGTPGGPQPKMGMQQGIGGMQQDGPQGGVPQGMAGMQQQGMMQQSYQPIHQKQEAGKLGGQPGHFQQPASPYQGSM